MVANRFALVSLLLIQSAATLAAGQAYVREAGTLLALGNDYLERTVSLAPGAAGTTGFVNKITGRSYTLGGPEFELKMIYERVGYGFGNENPMVVTAAGMRVSKHLVEDVAGGGKRIVLDLAPARGRGRGFQIQLIYELKDGDFYTRQWVHIAKPEQGTYFIDQVAVAKNEWGLPRFTLGGFGQPLFAGDLFLGVEYPTSINTAEGAEVTLGGYVGLNIPEGGYTSEPAVMGVAPAGQVHRQFLDYVDRMRVAPVRPFLLYNSWYDLQRLAMNHDNTLERVHMLDKLLLKKYGLHLDSFVLDDGWDDMQRLWKFDEQRFPGGFADLAAALEEINSRLGIWFGPIGGYDQRPVRIATGRREGMEISTNGQNLCLAGKNYGKLLSDTMAQFQKDYGVNYYKLDGVVFGCNDPNHGHPVGIYSREATARAFIAMLDRLRAQDRSVFLNITTSMWLSPWWLRYADTVWMGGADSGYLPSVPTLAARQSAVSYRDSVLYSDFIAHQAQFPISSLMTHGIIKGKYNMLGGNQEFLDDWKDEVVHYYSVGNMMYELYISPDILSPEEMDVLGNTTKWAEANAHPLLDNSTMVLGDPARRQPYGFVHSTAAKSIVMLRNPFVRPQTVRLQISEEHGFRKTDGPMVLEIQYPYRQIISGAVRFGDAVTFDLGGYEQIVLELRPASGERVRIEGARYAVVNKTVRVFAPEGSTRTVRLEGAADAAPMTLKFGASAKGELRFSSPALDSSANATERIVRVSTNIEVPGDYREAKLAFLIEPDQDLKGPTAEGLDNGKPLNLALENGGRAAWHWFYAALAPGRHELELTFHLPAAPAGARLSGWLLTKRTLAMKEISLNPAYVPKEILLPASSDIERATYSLVETSIR
jgi:hypothetical protein